MIISVRPLVGSLGYTETVEVTGDGGHSARVSVSVLSSYHGTGYVIHDKRERGIAGRIMRVNVFAEVAPLRDRWTHPLEIVEYTHPVSAMPRMGFREIGMERVYDRIVIDGIELRE